MRFFHPSLDKPVSGWKKDLPDPNDPPNITPHPLILSNPPNYLDHILLELPRSSLRVRGAVVWGAVTILLLSMMFPVGWIVFLLTTFKLPPFILTASGIFGFIIGIGTGIFFWRMDIEAPRDEPIRFNRIRRKVYIYRFHHCGYRLFSRTVWGVRPEVYEWDNLRAEASSIYGPMGTGGLIETVTLAVVEPGTNKVLDRFHFAHGIQQGEMYWAMAQLFMQQGPTALPTFPRPPRDWNNEDVTFNLARRLAPKVKWPHDMDLESRTAPH